MTATTPLPYAERLAGLRARLARLPGAIVAFSGGVDSTALLHLCVAVLGERVVAVTADSASLPRAELREAEELARGMAVRHVVLPTQELERPGYRANAGDRCYHCKNELFLTVAQRRQQLGPADWAVVYGAITDDLGDHRPGQRAAAEHGVLAPWVEFGFSKVDVRRYSREVGLPTADKQSFACLSSRVPFGMPIDAGVLARIERAEDVLRALGFRQFRVRHHDSLARVEVGAEELPQAFARREEIGRGLLAAGYAFVALDVFGYRSGAFNHLLHQASATKVSS
jgi:uncharacterized protein